uniref:phage tail tape measure protein n=1 Tax=Ornithobacterium rhinotracheale TaxID=28251 RepID=UPI0039A511CF
MSHTTNWVFNILDKVSAPLKKIQQEIKDTEEKLKNATSKGNRFGECLKRIRAIDWMAATSGFNGLIARFSEASQVGEKFETALLDVSAIAGVSGEKLDQLGDKARNLAKTFGTEATDNLETFKTILSRLGPQLGESDEAMEKMGTYVNTLAKTMGGDAKGATDALTTSMLQFKVNLEDPIAAAGEMERMMNVMAAGAKEGAAEVPQIAQALVQAGGAAKLSNVSFEETNAALQSLAKSGKYGAEAGVGLRNVLIKMNAPSALSKEATNMLKAYGVNMKKVADASVPFADRLRELQKIGKNTDALAAVFGAENIQAAQGLINTADAQAELTEQITGTNVAYEQSEIVMSGWSEKMKRAKAWIDDLKIGSFKVTSVVAKMGEVVGGAVGILGDFGAAYSGLSPLIKSTWGWLKKTIVVKKLSTFWTKTAATAQWAWNAALSANPIGIVIAAIAAMIALIVVAINKFDSWGSTMLLLLGPIGMVVSAVMMVKRHWDSIVEAFNSGGIIGALKRIGVVLLDVLMHPLQRILGWIANLTGWDWAEKAAGNVEEFRKKMNLISDEEKANAKKDEKPNDAPSTVISPNTVASDESGGGSISLLGEEDKKKKKGRTAGAGTGSGGGSGTKIINFKVEMKNYFSVDRSISSKEVAANGVVSKINDRLRDAVVAL